jgi:hypothetical protein
MNVCAVCFRICVSVIACLCATNNIQWNTGSHTVFVFFPPYSNRFLSHPAVCDVYLWFLLASKVGRRVKHFRFVPTCTGFVLYRLLQLLSSMAPTFKLSFHGSEFQVAAWQRQLMSPGSEGSRSVSLVSPVYRKTYHPPPPPPPSG